MQYWVFEYTNKITFLSDKFFPNLFLLLQTSKKFPLIPTKAVCVFIKHKSHQMAFFYLTP